LGVGSAYSKFRGGVMTGTLTKSDIISAVQRENEYTRKKPIELVEILLELVKTTLESGEDVLVSGFGKFCVQSKKERRGRNPATGEDLMLVPRKVVTFKCSGKLRKAINRQ
jgi:integration host factor subunit alpha